MNDTTQRKERSTRRRGMWRLAPALAVLASALIMPALGPVNVSAQPSHGGIAAATHLCFGTLTVTPSTARIGQKLTLRGRGFSCKSPMGELFRSAPVFFYRPDVGFRIFRTPVMHDGTYQRTIVVPAKVITAKAVNSGKLTKVKTRPGMYYFAISLFDVHLEPINRALAHVKIVR